MAWKPTYASSVEVKAYLGITDSADDNEVSYAVEAASRAIDRHTNRQFGLVSAPEARTYTARWDRDRCRYVVDIDDLMTVMGLEVATADGAVTDFSLKPGNAVAKLEPWTLLVFGAGVSVPTDEDGLTITARWGWTDVPRTVKQACLLQTSRLFKRRDAPFGVAGSPEIGSELRLLAKVDPDVAVVLGPYVRWWAAV